MRTVAIAATVGIMVFGGIALFRELIETDRSEFALIVTAYGGFFVGYFGGILVHELGHVIGGEIAGMEFRMITVGPVALSRAGGRFRLFLTGRQPMGGLVMMVFTSEETADRMRCHILGGPIASVISVLALYATSLALIGTGDHLAQTLWGGILTGALVILPGTLVPFSARGQQTDALMLSKIRKPGPTRDAVIARFILSRESLGGLRPRDWNRGAVETLMRDEVGETDRLQGKLMGYVYYSDQGDEALAQSELGQALELVKGTGSKFGVLGDSIRLSGALAAAEKEDYHLARELRDQATSKSELLRAQRTLVEAVIAVGERRCGDAQLAIDETERESRKIARRMGMNIEPTLERLERLRASLPNTPAAT